jgi:uncharacterized protein YfiM (DUF2279 family)
MRALALVIAFHFAPPADAGDRWFAPDKAKHFFMAAFVQSASYGALRLTGVHRRGALIGATVAASAVSVGKELYDREFGGDPSWKDLTWDAAGIAAATLVLRRTPR